MFQMGQTDFFIRQVPDGWEVVKEEMGDIHSKYFEYRLCWYFPTLRLLVQCLPHLVRIKLKSRGEKLQADPKPLERWLLTLGKEALPRLHRAEQSLAEALVPFKGYRHPEAELWSFPILDTPYVLKSVGIKGWEIHRMTPEGKLEFCWHAMELAPLFNRVPSLLVESPKIRRKAIEDIILHYEYQVSQTKKIILRLQQELCSPPRPPSVKNLTAQLQMSLKV